MTDLAAEYLPLLRKNRLSHLALTEEAVFPYYSGWSILNVPFSLCTWFDIPPLGLQPPAPLLHPAASAIGKNVRTVALILMDALSLFRLQRWMGDGVAPIWGELAEEGLLLPLTSVSPSTTSSALASLWTGVPPSVHGIVGYEMWLKEYGLVANMILHSPMSFNHDAVGLLVKAGLQPEEFLSAARLGQHLSDHGVQVYAYQHHSIVHSSLSQMLLKGASRRAFGTATDLWVNVRQFVESQIAQKSYLFIYWSELDSFSHRYGPDDERVAAEFSAFSQAFQKMFLDRMRPSGETLIILMADHGQVYTPQNPNFDLRNHPEFINLLHILPTGENRLAFLYVRPGQTKAVRAYVDSRWPGQFTLLTSAEVVQAGLFGDGEHHPRLKERVGDFLLVAHGDNYLWWAGKENQMLGRHGGLSPDEMIVPFLAVRI